MMNVSQPFCREIQCNGSIDQNAGLMITTPLSLRNIHCLFVIFNDMLLNIVNSKNSIPELNFCDHEYVFLPHMNKPVPSESNMKIYNQRQLLCHLHRQRTIMVKYRPLRESPEKYS